MDWKEKTFNDRGVDETFRIVPCVQASVFDWELVRLSDNAVVGRTVHFGEMEYIVRAVCPNHRYYRGDYNIQCLDGGWTVGRRFVNHRTPSQIWFSQALRLFRIASGCSHYNEVREVWDDFSRYGIDNRMFVVENTGTTGDATAGDKKFELWRRDQFVDSSNNKFPLYGIAGFLGYTRTRFVENMYMMDTEEAVGARSSELALADLDDALGEKGRVLFQEEIGIGDRWSVSLIKKHDEVGTAQNAWSDEEIVEVEYGCSRASLSMWLDWRIRALNDGHPFV